MISDLLDDLRERNKEYDEALRLYEEYSSAKPGDEMYDAVFQEMQDTKATKKAIRLLVSRHVIELSSLRASFSRRHLCGMHAHPARVAVSALMLPPFSQARQWERRADEIDEERVELHMYAEENNIDLSSFQKSEFMRTIQLDDATRANYEEATRYLDATHPYTNRLSTEAIKPLAVVDDDEEALKDVDVLDDTAEIGTGDTMPERMAIFHREADDKESANGIADEEDAPWTVLSALSFKGFCVPVDMRSMLKEHQEAALKLLIDRAALNAGAVLAHAPGLGKSLTTLSFLSCFKKHRATSRSIVVCAKSLLIQWKKEIAKFDDILHLEPFLVSDSDMLAYVHDEWRKSHGGVLLIGTDMFKNQFGKKESGASASKKAKGSRTPRCVFNIDSDTVIVVDEAHQQLQTGCSHFYDVIEHLDTKLLILLSGTPMQHSLRQYYNMVHLVAPDILPDSHMEFYKKYSKEIEEGAQKDADEDQQYMARLKLAMLERALAPAVPFISSVKVLPETIPGKTEFLIMHPCDEDADMAALSTGNFFDRRETVHAFTLDTKTSLLRLLLDQYGKEERFIIFSSRIQILKEIQERFADQESGLLTGETTDMYTRDRIITKFRETPGMLLFLTTDLGACGLNLACARRVVLLDVTWNPMIEAQAVARAYRLGQKQHVYVYRFCAMDTLEETAYMLGLKKHRLATSIADDNDVARVYDHGDLNERTGTDEAREERHAQTMKSMEEDEEECTILKNVCSYFDRELYISTHDDNVAVKKLDVDEIQNMVNNDLNRQDALADTRVLEDADDPVPIETIIGPNGKLVPPMPLAWLWQPHCTNKISSSFVYFKITSKKEEDEDADEDEDEGPNKFEEIFAVFAPSNKAYASIEGCKLELWRLTMNSDQLDPMMYDDDEWKQVDDDLPMNTAKGQFIKQGCNIRLMNYLPYFTQEGIWSYKTRIVVPGYEDGPFSAPSAALVITYCPEE